MTISKRDRMIDIIEQLNRNVDELPSNIVDRLDYARTILTNSDNEVVDQLSDKIFSKPAQEQTMGLIMNTPENILHSCYGELDRLSRSGTISADLEFAIQQMRYYFSIEEKDGFFP